MNKIINKFLLTGNKFMPELHLRQLRDILIVLVEDSKPYLSYLNKLLDQYNNTYHHSIGKKPIVPDFSVSTEEIESNYRARKFKIVDIVRITICKNNFSKSYTKNYTNNTIFHHYLLLFLHHFFHPFFCLYQQYLYSVFHRRFRTFFPYFISLYSLNTLFT